MVIVTDCADYGGDYTGYGSDKKKEKERRRGNEELSSCRLIIIIAIAVIRIIIGW